MIAKNQSKPQISLAFCAFFRVTDTRRYLLDSRACTCVSGEAARCVGRERMKEISYAGPQGKGAEADKQGTTLTAEVKHPGVKAACVATSGCTLLTSYPATEGRERPETQSTCLCLSTASQPSRGHIHGLT